jgi:hypothetical protein
MSLKSSKSHFRRLRFDQNNFGLISGPDSISDPVARRLCCTESYPSARGSAKLGSRLMTWHVGPTMLTCMMTGHWHGMLTGRWLGILASRLRHADVILIRVWHVGRLIRVKKTCVTCGVRLCAWAVSSPMRDSACGGFQRPISMRFSIVASSRPPLHSGMVKTQFWQFLFLSKIKHPFKPCALIPIVGDSVSPMRGPVVYWYLLKGG